MLPEVVSRPFHALWCEADSLRTEQSALRPSGRPCPPPPAASASASAASVRVLFGESRAMQRGHGAPSLRPQRPPRFVYEDGSGKCLRKCIDNSPRRKQEPESRHGESGPRAPSEHLCGSCDFCGFCVRRWQYRDACGHWTERRGHACCTNHTRCPRPGDALHHPRSLTPSIATAAAFATASMNPRM